MHLSLDPDERATHVADVLKMFAGEDSVVLAGDLNEGSDGNAWRALARALSIVTGDGLTFPAADPRHRIDVIFASPNLPVVPGSPVELDRADLVAATDHLPVWADLDISALALS
jgi:endonuclease/exonuclease/phosphatase family metal-dependent hydrolase